MGDPKPQKHGLKYETVHMTFDDFDDVKLWIYRNQIGRRNLKSFKDIETTIKLKPAIQAEAKRRQASHTTQGYLKSDKPVHTDKELGKLAHVGKSTIREVEYVLNNGSEETKELARSDKISIHDAYKRTVKENEPPKPDVPTTPHGDRSPVFLFSGDRPGRPWGRPFVYQKARETIRKMAREHGKGLSDGSGHDRGGNTRAESQNAENGLFWRDF